MPTKKAKLDPKNLKIVETKLSRHFSTVVTSIFVLLIISIALIQISFVAFVRLALESPLLFIILFVFCGLFALLMLRETLGGFRKAVKTVCKTYLAFALNSFVIIIWLLVMNIFAHSRGYGIVFKFGFIDVSTEPFVIFTFMMAIFSHVYFTIIFLFTILLGDQGDLIKKIIAIMIWVHNQIHRELGDESLSSGKRPCGHSEWYYFLSSMGAVIFMLPVVIFSASQIVWIENCDVEVMSPYAFIFSPALGLVTIFLMASLVADRLGIFKCMSWSLMIKPITLPFMLSLFQLMTIRLSPFAQGVIISTFLSIFTIFGFMVEMSRLITTGRETQLVDDIESLLSA